MSIDGGNADSDEAIRPLRLGLAEAGWDTLALQLPVELRSAGAVQDTDAVSAARPRIGRRQRRQE